MVKLKTAEEIESLRQGGRILAGILQKLAAAVAPGVSTWELNRLAEEEIKKAGAEPSFIGYGKKPFPAALCTSVNEVIVHGAPYKSQILKEGDIIGLDLGIKYLGFYTDAAISVPVGKVSPLAERLLGITKKALDLAVAAAWPGARIGDIGWIIQTTAEKAGFAVVRELVGHGVGYAVHEDPKVPCYGKKGEGLPLEIGMVLAIEPMLTAGDYHLVTLPDGWGVKTRDGSLGAHFEHTVAVTKNGPEVLTALPTSHSASHISHSNF
jgi:methionyl aminopeptidase